MVKKIKRLFGGKGRVLLLLIALAAGIAFTAIDWDTAANWIMGAAAVIGMIPILRGILGELRMRTFSPEIITAIAVTSAVILGEQLVAVTIVIIAAIRQILVKRALVSAGADIKHLTGNQPETARLLRGRKEFEVPVNNIHSGHKILVKANETVPIDGIDSHGSLLLSGSVVTHDTVLRISVDAADSFSQKVTRIASSSAKSDAPFIRLSARYVPVFSILSLALAAGVWYFSGDSERFLEVLVVATPGYLSIGATVALLAGINRAAKNKIFVRSGSVLERLAMIKSAVMESNAKLKIDNVKIIPVSTKATLGEKIRTVEAEKNMVAYVSFSDEDTPVLTSADVGISYKPQGAALDAASVIITGDSKSLVSTSFSVARETFAAARLSVLVGFVISLALQILLASGNIEALAGAVLLILVDASAITFALRASSKKASKKT